MYLIFSPQAVPNVTIKKRTLGCLHTSAIANEKDNKKTDKSTSETTRGTSFNFETYRKLSGLTPDKISDDWLAWFIGFAEGDGAIFTGKDKRLRFVLTQKDISILKHIHEKLRNW